MLIWKCFKADIYIILILQTIFQDIKLKDTYNAHDDLFHTGIKLLENLNGTFLCDLVDTFDELFTFHGIDLAYTCEMLRCESRDSFKSKFFTRCTDRITDGKDARIENKDEVDVDNLTGTSDMKKVIDMKGNPLLLFVNEWSVGMTLDRNEGLVLAEFSKN